MDTGRIGARGPTQYFVPDRQKLAFYLACLSIPLIGASMMLGPTMVAYYSIVAFGSIASLPAHVIAIVAAANFLAGGLTVLGLMLTIRHASTIWQFEQAFREGIIVDRGGLTVPVWRRGRVQIDWFSIEAASVVRGGGLFKPPLVVLRVDGKQVHIPAGIERREELVDLVISRVGLSVCSQSWWAIRYRR